MDHKLDTIRQQINTIDDELLALISKRSDLLHAVLAAKIESADGAPVKIFVPEREQKIIQRMTMKNKSQLADDAIATIFQSIISACRNFEITSNNKKNEPIAISIQGISGSFTEQAAKKYCQQKSLLNPQLEYAISSEQVLQNLAAGKTPYGLVGINNAQGGLVKETIDALLHHHYRIVDTVSLLVQHSLLVLPGTKASQIKYIYSHPQALKQCAHYLKRTYPQCELIPSLDTALSAVDLAAGRYKQDSAVIAHITCAEKNKLQVLAGNIQDLDDNETLFLILKAAPKNEQ